MNIALIGSGGREHALCKKIYSSKIVKKIICFPGNAGTSEFADNIPVNILNFKKVYQLITKHNAKYLVQANLYDNKIFLKNKFKINLKFNLKRLIQLKSFNLVNRFIKI